MRYLDHMAVFAQVVQSGSFSGAARQLAMPLSTVSRKVSDLENHLQVKLLERSTRSLRLTESGKLYFGHCLRGLEAFKHADLAIAERQSEVAGQLQISIPPSLAETIFVPITGKFQLRYPKARVNILISERLLDFIGDAIDLSFRFGPLVDSNLHSRKLARYRHRLVASPGYLASAGSPGKVADLSGHRLIGFGFPGKPRLRWCLEKGNRQEEIVFAPDLGINDYAAVQRALVLGQGIGELPSILCQEALKKQSLIEVLPDWRFAEVDLLAVHRGRKNMPRLASLYLDCCIEHINSCIG
ncbi:LysR family transcriptional regulator [Kiloniella laminariae]|uniref:LysR family transcriptional regulator n=1 Tax=Kiloniella laminariae TaxID=454162 RepID=UPI00039E648D|nr:LysR family transcriptional regulator [Kiloniella laminariae]